MYRFSLDDFVSLYRKSLNIGKEKKNSNQIKKFISKVIMESYLYFSRTILKNDLILFAIFFVKTIFYDNNIFSNEEIELDSSKNFIKI